MKNKTYDVIVIGGGHAGCEAALASSKMMSKTLLVTMHPDMIGFMSCNPAIGGIGKGQLVKEVDALGGHMARATDACGIQFRILNASKGAAVHSSRVQVDRKLYQSYIQNIIKRQSNLDVLEGEVVGLILKDGLVEGIETDTRSRILAKTVIITPGTFLNGVMHIGMKHFAGGRIEEKSSSLKLSSFLKNSDFKLLRFKTGTCARLDGKTIDFSKLRAQQGDLPIKPFSFSTNHLKTRQIPCYITYTDEKTHAIIRKNLDRSPLFSGKITGTGVRYCPSLEDKVVKFPHHKRHQIFLEPEGRTTDEFYPNGLSTSLPEDVQTEFIHSIPGLEKVKINRFGYGIEHDVVDPRQLFSTMETKLIRNLYLAGQINGTTGYEEAAAQGLIAGINASLRSKNKDPFILDRSNSYIGVLIDDLITKGTNEPYRMFTSRVEYRLILREDNADLRLSKFGFDLGLVDDKTYKKSEKKRKDIEKGIAYLKEHSVSGKDKKITLYTLLKRPSVSISGLKKDHLSGYSVDALKGIEVDVKYAGFIRRQFTEVRNFKHLEKINLSKDFDYSKVPGLSLEIKEKLSHFKPLTLGQASRISGLTPVAITILMVYLKKIRNEKRTSKIS